MRSHIVKSSGLLAARQLLSVLLKLVGVFIISHILGPGKYGAYIAAYSVYTFVLGIGQAGVGIYLLRHEGELSDRHIGTATTFLLAQSLTIVAIIELAAPYLAAYTKIEGFQVALQVMILALPLQTLGVPGMVRIERAIDLKNVALIELSSQALYYALALPLALIGFGALGLSIALVFQYAIMAMMIYTISRAPVIFNWDQTIFKDILGYMTSFSFANFMWQMRSLINPFIVGPVLGAQAVGLIGMAVSILELLTIIRTMIWRIMVAALAKFQSDTEKLRRLITEGMEIQLLMIGAVLLAFGWIGEWVVPVVFGKQWLPLFDVYPFVALAYLNMATFNTHLATLSVLNRNWQLSLFQGTNAAVVALVTFLCVQPFGIVGYGLGEIAGCLTYVVLHVIIARLVGSPDYRLSLIWWAATAVGLFWRDLGLWAIAVPFATLLMPPSLKRIKGLIAQVQAARKQKAVAA